MDFSDECSSRLDILSLGRKARSLREGRAEHNLRQIDRDAAEQPRDGIAPPHLHASFSIPSLGPQKSLSVTFVRDMGREGAVEFAQGLVLFELSLDQDFGDRPDIASEVRLNRRDVCETGRWRRLVTSFYSLPLRLCWRQRGGSDGYFCGRSSLSSRQKFGTIARIYHLPAQQLVERHDVIGLSNCTL